MDVPEKKSTTNARHPSNRQNSRAPVIRSPSPQRRSSMLVSPPHASGRVLKPARLESPTVPADLCEGQPAPLFSMSASGREKSGAGWPSHRAAGTVEDSNRAGLITLPEACWGLTSMEDLLLGGAGHLLMAHGCSGDSTGKRFLSCSYCLVHPLLTRSSVTRHVYEWIDHRSPRLKHFGIYFCGLSRTAFSGL